MVSWSATGKLHSYTPKSWIKCVSKSGAKKWNYMELFADSSMTSPCQIPMAKLRKWAPPASNYLSWLASQVSVQYYSCSSKPSTPPTKPAPVGLQR